MTGKILLLYKSWLRSRHEKSIKAIESRLSANYEYWKILFF